MNEYINVKLFVQGGEGAEEAIAAKLDAWFSENVPTDDEPFPPGTLLYYSYAGRGQAPPETETETAQEAQEVTA